MSRKRALLILGLTIIFGVGIRAYHLTARSLWFDEAFSWRVIQFPLPELLSRAAADVHPPLYYLALKAWAFVFGTSITSLRYFSLAAAAASLAAIYLLVTELLHGSRLKTVHARSGGLVAALLLAASAWQIPIAWEARMYTLGTFLVLLASWLLVKAIRQPHPRPWWWVAYGLVAAAGLYTHYYIFFTLIAHALIILGVLLVQSRGRIGEIVFSPQAWYAGGTYVLVAALLAPWLPTFLQQSSRVQQDFWIAAPDRWSIPDTLYRMVMPTAADLTHTWPAVVVTLLPLTAAILAGILLLSITSVGWFIVAGAGLPFIGSIMLSSLSQSVYIDRLFVFSHVFMVAGLAMLIHFIPWRWVKRIALATAVTASLGLFWSFRQEIAMAEHPGVQAAMRYLAAAKPAGDPMFATSPFIFFPALYYAEEELQTSTPLRLAFAEDKLTHYNGQPILKEDEVVSPQSVAALDAKSAWFIETTGFYASPLSLPSPWRKVEEKTFPEVFIYQGDVIVRHYVRN